MLTLEPTSASGLRWAQSAVAEHHYLHSPVDPRSRPLAYLLRRQGEPCGCLIFGRPEATRCYQGGLTYGSQEDVAAGRAAWDRWSVLNLARVWLDPRLQQGGPWCRPGDVPGFHDRKGVWRPAVASWAIREALARVGYDYLLAHPPVYLEQPYRIEACLSYCDTRLHRGTIYRSSGFRLSRTNAVGIETWWTPAVTPLSPAEDAEVRRRAGQSERGARIRGRQVLEPGLF